MTPIEAAISQIGKEELPRGSNWGEHVQKYLKSVGINFPASWCMAFVYWCTDEWAHNSGHKNPLLKTGGVIMQWNQIDPILKHKDNFPRGGDIFIMDFGHGLGHTGFIEKTEDDKKGYTSGILHTIEGNTNDTGSREGYEVCRRERHIKNIKGYIRLPLV